MLGLVESINAAKKNAGLFLWKLRKKFPQRNYWMKFKRHSREILKEFVIGNAKAFPKDLPDELSKQTSGKIIKDIALISI